MIQKLTTEKVQHPIPGLISLNQKQVTTTASTFIWARTGHRSDGQADSSALANVESPDPCHGTKTDR